ncbi:MAG: type IX secretion system sortase PorU [Bacteroidales bacterium]|nr:type IX secretion system sortase PorU [Bacteroidales bacterium]
MKYKTLVIFLFFIPVVIFAQHKNYHRKIKWKGVQTIKISESESMSFLTFDGAVNDFDSDFLPVYFERFKLNSISVDINVLLKNKIFKELNPEEIKNIKTLDRIKTELILNSSKTLDRKEPYVSISFIPIRKNPDNGKYEKLISFDMELYITDLPNEELFKRTYKQNSVLSSGNWYKIRSQYTGIHKISYNDLINMGMDVNSINPKNLRLYGNGGGMLPESNIKFRYDDLEENAIIVVGEDDQNFDENDYILFYAESPNDWDYNEIDGKFYHTSHLYSNYTYYFITADLGTGKRINIQTSSTQTPTNYVTKFDGVSYHETDNVNLIKSGRVWYGEIFDMNTSYEFPISFPDIDVNSEVYLKINVAAKSTTSSSFDVYINNNKITNIIVSAASGTTGSNYAKSSTKIVYFYASGSNFTLKIVYNKSTSNSIGWLNYFELNAKRHLKFNNSQLSFRDINSVGTGNISEFTLSNASSSVIIWNVTNPTNVKKIDAILNGNNLTFSLPTDTLQEFIAFDGSDFYSPQFIEKIKNQDLHGLGQYEMIIISHPNFINEANNLASYHENNDNMSVLVVKPQTIYNEFSSGGQDITAIRDFIKMFYDRANPGEEPKYLLLFGDGSYDNKNRISNNTNYIPTWQSSESLNETSSYVTDDFYGFLDDVYPDNTLDIGIGRFPVATLEQAVSAADKVIHYSNNTKAVMGDWRNVICLIADDEDGNMHLNHAEELAVLIDTTTKNINIDKIYFDAYQQISTPGGQRYPEANEAINNRVDKGALVINYVGHGGEVGWSHERVLEISDINSWTNYDKMPVFITATCEFSRYDDPGRTSAGELVFLNNKGGAVALFTTARATYGSINSSINKSFYKYALNKIDGEYLRMGDIIRLTKIESGSNDNGRKYVLLGDPALKMAYPHYNVVTTSINNNAITLLPDTIRALDKVTIEGVIEDNNGNIVTDFNGIVYPIVYDKPSKISTLANDHGSQEKTFYLQKNILYKGKANIINGKFSFTFISPKDIAYQYGFGKISYYADNDHTDASGYNVNIIIGGYNENSSVDNNGPLIELYLNDENFVFGGITNENPILLAYLEDESGINTVGNGIGHDIVAIIGYNDKSYILNDYYEADLDSYQKGTLIYPFFDLSEGLHTLSLKVWDVYNNSSEAYTEFIVAESSEMVLDHLLNFPNPFRHSTTFSFQHNQADTDIDIKIEIYSLSGKLVKIIDEIYYSGGFKYKSKEWDGTNDYGSKLAKGMYVYKVVVKNIDGSSSEETQKLVILK